MENTQSDIRADETDQSARLQALGEYLTLEARRKELLALHPEIRSVIEYLRSGDADGASLGIAPTQE